MIYEHSDHVSCGCILLCRYRLRISCQVANTVIDILQDCLLISGMSLDGIFCDLMCHFERFHRNIIDTDIIPQILIHPGPDKFIIGECLPAELVDRRDRHHTGILTVGVENICRIAHLTSVDVVHIQ